ncbi:MAG TPA: AAA family ATPase, partial [Polyangiaceae bacterium]|nr:AAA family ATPase [Polyangiaceae bacterium]
MRDDLIARAEPLEKLRGALAQASSGRGGLALILGEAGIGKTSLVGALAREADASGVEVVSGRAWELAESPPYFPLWECFRLLGIDRSEQSDPFRLWERVLAALAERAARRAMVWVLDDLHAADLLTLDLLTFLARPVRATKLLILATAREKDPRISPRGAQRLARMARDGIEISLGPLSKSAIAELVERVSGRPHAGLTDVLFTRTEGNPLFAVECARMIRAAPPGKLDTLRSLPPTVRQLVVERIAPLSAETRAVIDAAAVLGREFASGRVAKLLGHLPAQVIEALRPALDAGVVAERRPGHFAFTHILVRDAVEEAISAAAAIELHRRAEAMLALEGEGVEVVVERARHALAALKEGAITLAFDAARLLENEGAFDRALAMHERIDEARLKGHLTPMGPEEQLERARLLHAAGRSAEAEALCDEIAAGARRSGSATLLARAALTRGSELRPAMVNTELVTLLRAALAMPSGDRKLTCRVEARLAAALQPARDPQGPMELARRAIRSARELHDGKLLVDVLNWAGSALVDAAPLEERMELNQELFDGALREGEPLLALRAQIRLGLDRIELGEIDQWLAGAERVRELSAELGHPRHRWRALLFASMCSLARGDIVGAERAIVEVKELSGLYEDPALALALNAHLGQTARLLHRDDEIRSTAAALEQGLGESVVGDREIGLLLRLGCFAQLEDR